jgi:hypothetical protein
MKFPIPLLLSILLQSIVSVLVAAEDGADGTNSDSTGKPAPTRYRWEQEIGETLALVGPYGIIWRLNFSPDLTKPYFHPLRTTDGRTLTWVSPPDHPWHYGLWHSWKLIDGIYYWEEDRTSGKPKGVTQIIEVNIQRTDETGAAVEILLAYHPADHPEENVMDEQILLEIGMPQEDGSYRILWRQKSSARKSVLLDRTPLQDEPGGNKNGGYGGLSLRGGRYLRDVSVVNSRGITDRAAHGQPADWMLLTGTIDNRSAGVSMFDHPENPRHPTPWFVVMEQPLTGPFWYINAAFVHDQPFRLNPGEPLIRTYLVRVDRATPSVEVLNQEFLRFSRWQP